MILSVPRVYSTSDRINECGTVGGIRIDGGNQSTWRKTAPLFRYVCTNPRQIDLGLLRCEAGDSLRGLWHGLLQDVSYLSISVQ